MAAMGGAAGCGAPKPKEGLKEGAGGGAWETPSKKQGGTRGKANTSPVPDLVTKEVTYHPNSGILQHLSPHTPGLRAVAPPAQWL